MRCGRAKAEVVERGGGRSYERCREKADPEAAQARPHALVAVVERAALPDRAGDGTVDGPPDGEEASDDDERAAADLAK